ncbi:OmpA family protein [Aquimarina sp. D1M17]|uniref:OmpA family protein n=1 Tax=Aquimarina acroporae TaxID=2937283 RepID=UPI0020C082F4|nr:OmpA family protein [Aquimarina acroporae]MCK8521994.1 OmpA family protein [Aquimarina acroporae]
MKLNFSIFLFILLSTTNAIWSQRTITVSIEKTDYLTGEIIQSNFKTSSPLAQRSWIGLFKASTPHGNTSNYINYHYINEKTSASFDFEAPVEPGAYELRVFEEEYGKELKSIPLNVMSIDPNLVTLSILTKEIKPSQPFDVKIESSFTLNPKAWIGIFDPKTSKDEITYISYEYVTSRKGNILRLSAPENIGDYELRFYAADPGALVKRVPFRIGALKLDGLRFSLNKKEYEPEEDIIISYTGHKDLTDRAWIGLFKADATPNDYKEFLDYEYLNPKIGGTLTIKAPSTKGAYQARLFYADLGPQLLSPIAYVVTSSLDKDFIKKTIDTKGKITLYGIYFDTNKSIIKPSSHPLISQIAQMLKANPHLKIRIEGHTDSQGDDAYNQTLSEKRSAAVREYLIKKYEVPTGRLESKGYGETKPVGDNKTSAGRAKNRRVELVKI